VFGLLHAPDEAATVVALALAHVLSPSSSSEPTG